MKAYVMAALLTVALVAEEKKPDITADERLALSRLQTRVYAVHDAHKDAVLKLQRAQQDVDKLTKQIEQVKAEYGVKVVELRKKYNKDAGCEITVNTQEWDCPKTASK